MPMTTATKSLPYRYDGSRQYWVNVRFVYDLLLVYSGDDNDVKLNKRTSIVV